MLMESESDSNVTEGTDIPRDFSESGSEETDSWESWESCPRERWEAVAGLMRSARGMGRLEALESVLPHLPDGPVASAIEHALMDSNSLPTTLRAAEKVAVAMARVEELLEFL